MINSISSSGYQNYGMSNVNANVSASSNANMQNSATSNTNLVTSEVNNVKDAASIQASVMDTANKMGTEAVDLVGNILNMQA